MENILQNLRIKNVYSVVNIFSEEGKGAENPSRSAWAILIKYEGETVYTSNGKTYISNSESAVIIPKGSNYKWRCVKPGHCLIVDFDADVMGTDILTFTVKNSEKILAMLKNVENNLLKKKSFYQLESIKDIYSVILMLIASSCKTYTPTSKQQKINAAAEYILEHYPEKIKNEQLAKMTGLSTQYFRQLFFEVYGISPISYVISLRIKKAKEMLRSDYSTISDIASAVGYSSVYNFSNDFKKHVGVSPERYAKYFLENKKIFS